MSKNQDWGNKREEIGVVKFVHKNGFGFVIREGDGPDAFFHVNRLPEQFRDGPNKIEAGDRVRMIVGDGPKGPVALTIAKLED